MLAIGFALTLETLTVSFTFRRRNCCHDVPIINHGKNGHMRASEIYLQFEKQLNSLRRFVMAEERARRSQPGVWKIKPTDISAAKVLDFAKKLAEVRTFIDAPKLVAMDLIGAMSVIEVGDQITEAEMDSGYQATANASIYGLLAEVVYGVAVKHG
jgi:hypothetical protein